MKPTTWTAMCLWAFATFGVGCAGPAESSQSPDAGGASESGSGDGWAPGWGGDSSGGRPTDGSATDGASTDAAADAALTDKSCADMARWVDCVDCCQQIHAAGILAWIGYLRDCLCADGSTCQASCATDICAGPPEPPPGGLPAGACLACGGSASCGNELGTRCSASADCTAYFACENGCPSAADAGGHD